MSDHESESATARHRPSGAGAFLLTVAAVVIAVVGMKTLAWLIAPLLLAVFIIVVIFPIYTWLLNKRAPRFVALGGLLVAVFAILAALVLVVFYALSRLASMLPEYSDRMRDALADVAALLDSAGIGAAQVRELLNGIDLLTVASWLTAQIPSIISVLTSAGFVAIVLIFVGIEATQIRDRTEWLRTDHPGLAASLSASLGNIRRFITFTSLFAVIVGAVDSVFLFFLGIPLALLWGVLAAVCNYVPYVGFIVGMVPPALLALVLQGPQAMLLVIVVYIVLNFIITSLIPAKVIGDAVGLSMVVQIVCVVFWAWVLGPLGAILALPLTLFLKAAFIDANPRARWLDGFLSSHKRIRARLANDEQ